MLGVGLLALLAAPFILHAITRGLSLHDPEEQLFSRFVGSDAEATWSIYAHMVAGGLLTALVLAQLPGAVRRRWPRVHHVVGYLVGVLSVLTGVLGLFYIAREGTIGGWVMSLGFAVYGLLLILAAVQTIRFARRRDHRHAGWAGRLIILALASWFFRVQYGLWEIGFGQLGRSPDFSGWFDQVMSFGFYLPWLVVYEAVRRGRTRRAVAGLKPPTGQAQ